jgi:hypothetical protein
VFAYGYSGTYTATVTDSRILAGHFVVRNEGRASSLVLVATTQMAGVGNYGTNITCAGVYDENCAFSASSCP